MVYRILSLLLFGLLIAAPETARAAELFTVRPVPVDATADSASRAREQALAQGQRQAFRRLLESMTARADHSRLPNPPKLDEVIADFSVEQEKSSSVRYIASLVVRFKADSVRNLLRQAGLAFAETASKPILVLPILWIGDDPLLWEERNVWFKVWAERPTQFSLSPVQLPLGDAADLAAINGHKAASIELDRLEAMKRRYGVGDVLLAEIAATPGSAAPSYELRLTRLSNPASLEALTVAGPAGETPPATLRRAVEVSVASVEEAWKRDNLIASAERTGSLAVLVPFSGIEEWTKLRERLGRIPLIRRHEVVALGRSGAQILLHHAGERGQLINALAQNDLTLASNESGWVLTPARRSGGR
ncbi:MAG: DUF2066 domain-containing protein [Rhodospirillales bacterium]|nr:DUF2066 domain-containing protein [Rhodospirillales bacterium]